MVFTQELGEHAVFVIRCKVDMLYINANHIGHSGRVDEVLLGGAVLVVIVIFPVLHEDANHLVALLFQQQRGDGRVHPAAQAHHDALFFQRRFNWQTPQCR